MASNKLHFYFRNIPKNARLRLEADEEALYSITECGSAQTMTNYILDLPGITKNSTITDLTACVGGNTASFARYFSHVNAVEKDETRCGMLCNNMFNVMNLENIAIINGDLVEEIHRIEQDVIFIDPPWGGPNYKNQKYLRLFINEIPLSSVILDMLGRARYIVIKLPCNFDCREFNNALKSCARVCYRNKDLRNMKLVIIEPFT